MENAGRLWIMKSRRLKFIFFVIKYRLKFFIFIIKYLLGIICSGFEYRFTIYLIIWIVSCRFWKFFLEIKLRSWVFNTWLIIWRLIVSVSWGYYTIRLKYIFLHKFWHGLIILRSKRKKTTKTKNFLACVACKNQVGNRQKLKFMQLDFSYSIFQQSSADLKGSF